MRLAASFAVAVSIAASPATAQPKVPVDPSLAASDKVLLQDETKAIAELRHRLRSQVNYRNGLLVIIDRSGTNPGVTVMPATVTWGIDCSDRGLSIVFGSGSGDTDNGLELQLTSAAIGDDACTRIAAAVGETVLAIIGGN